MVTLINDKFQICMSSYQTNLRNYFYYFQEFIIKVKEVKQKSNNIIYVILQFLLFK